MLGSATTSNFAITNLANSLLAVNGSGTVVATSSISTNLLTGTLGVGNGGTGISSTPAYGQLLVGNGATYTLSATARSVSRPLQTCLADRCRISFALAGNATSTLTQFNGGLTAFASSTIGNGGVNGLTINGNATTTGSAYINGALQL